MDKFYYIKIINTRSGKRGYVGEKNDGEIIVSYKFFQATKMFPTYQEAQKYIREKKLERSGATCHIRDNEDLMKESQSPFSESDNIKAANGDVYVIVNELNQRCFFDSEKGYFFKDGEVGCIAFFSLVEATEFIKKKNFDFNVKPIKL